MAKFSFLSLIVLLMNLAQRLNAISSPIPTYRNYTYATELQSNLADLWWSIDDVRKEITFEFHLNTTGWIALGISPGTITCNLFVTFESFLFTHTS